MTAGVKVLADIKIHPLFATHLILIYRRLAERKYMTVFRIGNRPVLHHVETEPLNAPFPRGKKRQLVSELAGRALEDRPLFSYQKQTGIGAVLSWVFEELPGLVYHSPPHIRRREIREDERHRACVEVGSG